MSRRNKTINNLIQGTGLWAALTAPQRKTMKAMLERAYSAGASHAHDDMAAEYTVPEPLAGVIHPSPGGVFINADGEYIVEPRLAEELILVRADGTTTSTKTNWETGWAA